MPVVWDADNEARLLMAYIEVSDAKLPTEGWKAVAEKLGEEATVGAISQRFTKTLKKKYGGDNCVLSSSGGGGAGSTTSTTSTPAKSRGRGKKKGDDPDKTPRASPLKRGAKDSSGDPEDEDEGLPESPTKKSKANIKAEDELVDQKDPNDV